MQVMTVPHIVGELQNIDSENGITLGVLNCGVPQFRPRHSGVP